MLKRTLLPLLLLAAATLSAADKQPITHETLTLMKRVGAPSYDEKEQATDLWLVPADGSAAPRKITAMKAGESDPAWSPDSKRIAFAAKRDADEVSQIYLLDLAGGEAQRV